MARITQNNAGVLRLYYCVLEASHWMDTICSALHASSGLWWLYCLSSISSNFLDLGIFIRPFFILSYPRSQIPDSRSQMMPKESLEGKRSKALQRRGKDPQDHTQGKNRLELKRRILLFDFHEPTYYLPEEAPFPKPSMVYLTEACCFNHNQFIQYL